MKDDIMLGDTPKARNRRSRVKGIETRGRLWKHSTVADLDGLISAQDLDGLFLFALVRNPWARAVSYYHWLRRQDFDHPAVRIAKAHDFSPFLNHRLITNSFRASPARHYVTDATGRERPRCSSGWSISRKTPRRCSITWASGWGCRRRT